MKIETNKVFTDIVGNDYLEQLKDIQPLYGSNLREALIVRDAADCYYLLDPGESLPHYFAGDPADFYKHSNQEKLDLEHWHNDIFIKNYFKKVPRKHQKKNINANELASAYRKKREGASLIQRALMQHYFDPYLGLDGMTIIMQGLKFAFELAEKLGKLFPSVSFKVIFSFQTIEDKDGLGIGPSPVIEFYKNREGAYRLTENLDDYKTNGLLTIDTAARDGEP